MARRCCTFHTTPTLTRAVPRAFLLRALCVTDGDAHVQYCVAKLTLRAVDGRVDPHTPHTQQQHDGHSAVQYAHAHSEMLIGCDNGHEERTVLCSETATLDHKADTEPHNKLLLTSLSNTDSLFVCGVHLSRSLYVVCVEGWNCDGDVDDDQAMDTL